MVSPTENLEQDLARQRNFVEANVPVYARLLDLLEAALHSEFRERLDEAWQHRAFHAWYERPLLLLAALRAAAFELRECHPLGRALSDTTPDPDALSHAALAEATAPGSTLFWESVRQRTVQTNEVSRAVAWLWPAALMRDRPPDAVIDLHDIGASAGLNLVADRLPWPWLDETGAELVTRAPNVGQRTGYDVCPLDPSDPSARSWLRACIWPGQTARFERLDAAFDAYDGLRRGGQAPRLHAAPASKIPALLAIPHGAAIAYQTVVRGYLSPAESMAYEAGMHAWLRKAPGRAVWIELEPTRTQDVPDRSAAVTAHVADRAERVIDLQLATCHPHPSILHVEQRAVAELAALLD
jgi:hypothetical protein